MAKCTKCDGRGWYENPRYPLVGSWAGIPSFKCGKCKETGYVIGNVKDVLQFLKHLRVKFEYDKEYREQVDQCIAAIEK